MSPSLESIRTLASDPRLVRPFGIFAPWRLNAYGYTVAVIYAVLLVSFYRAGGWLVDSNGMPVLSDFTNTMLAGAQALHGEIAALYDPAEYAKLQAAVVGPRDVVYPNWLYPPTFLLILAPLALLPHLYAFIAWAGVTLVGCLVVVYLIVQRIPAIALVLASPFTVWNLAAGQNGFLTATLLGGSLLFLERRPVLAGVFLGCLTYKPHFGLLFPVALAASRQWRAFASAAATAVLLGVASILAFGIAGWEALLRELAPQTSDYLGGNSYAHRLLGGWGRIHTVYGLIRDLNGGATLAWLAQGLTTSGVAVIVWLVWRSRVVFSLKAATLSAAALIATPYAFPYDMAAIVIPFAFLANDQIHRGLLPGEQTVAIGLFAVSLAVLITGSFAATPVGPVATIALLGVILRRALCYGSAPLRIAKIFETAPDARD